MASSVILCTKLTIRIVYGKKCHTRALSKRWIYSIRNHQTFVAVSWQPSSWIYSEARSVVANTISGSVSIIFKNVGCVGLPGLLLLQMCLISAEWESCTLPQRHMPWTHGTLSTVCRPKFCSVLSGELHQLSVLCTMVSNTHAESRLVG